VKHEGTAGPSFAKFVLENQKQYGLQDEELAYLSGGIFGAGADPVGLNLYHVLLSQLIML
jgi:hypothetical protein